jgi:(carboxyethyl)arginine beta-lactam-synthase
VLTAFYLSLEDKCPASAPRFSAAGRDETFELRHSKLALPGWARFHGGEDETGASTDANLALISMGPGTYRARTQALLKAVQDHGVDALTARNGVDACVLLRGDVLYLSAPKTAGPPLYLLWRDGRPIAVSSEIKAFAVADLVMTDMREEDLHWTPFRTAFEHVRMVPPGHQVRIDLQGRDAPRLYPYWSPTPQRFFESEDEAMSTLRACLSSAVDALPQGELLSFVSGGLDSSSVTTLAARQGRDILAYSVGTSDHNEFSQAQAYCDAIGTTCNRVLVTEEELIAEYIHVIDSAEHGHSTYLEYLAPGHLATRKVCRAGQHVISGYGSDILFGGFALDGQSDVGDLVSSEYRSTLWSAEASHVLGYRFGATIHYPFFHPDLVAASFQVPSAWKWREGWEKWILRKAVSGLLPEHVAWRRKIGIHQSTGMEKLMTQHLALEMASTTEARRLKNRFSAMVLRMLFVDQARPDELDIAQLSELFISKSFR